MASSDLELSKGVELNLPQLTTASPYSSSVDTAKCDTLLKSSKITTPCAGLENLISTMYDQCLTLVLQTEKQDLAVPLHSPCKLQLPSVPNEQVSVQEAPQCASSHIHSPESVVPKRHSSSHDTPCQMM
jgi:hypothetical protein